MLATCVMLISCLDISSTLKMEAIYSSETPVDFQRITQRYIPDDRTFLITAVITTDRSMCLCTKIDSLGTLFYSCDVQNIIFFCIGV
jgi:hypothetical protein